MTRANSEQLRHTPWFAKAGAACSIVPISRFVGPDIFALKAGGYGCLFSLTGIDEEGLTDQDWTHGCAQSRALCAACPKDPASISTPESCLVLIFPGRAKYSEPRHRDFRRRPPRFLEKTAGFRRIDLHWCLTIEPSQLTGFEPKAS